MTYKTRHLDTPRMLNWVTSLDSLLSTMDSNNETNPTSLRQTMKKQNEPKPIILNYPLYLLSCLFVSFVVKKTNEANFKK
jgi:hypothetical protein